MWWLSCAVTVPCCVEPQTGSGKTYTMLGDASNPGLVPRAIELLFTRARFLKEDGWRVDVALEVLEIYNETIKDLLTTGA